MSLARGQTEREVIHMSEASMTKDQWVELFKAVGIDDETMKKWHVEFERRAPLAHQSFLQWLGLSPTEVVAIRERFQE
jgi:hypothetical protein